MKLTTTVLPETLNRVLSVSLISLTASFCYLIYFIITGAYSGVLIYLLIGLVYLVFYIYFKGKGILLAVLAVLFYLVHTTVELSLGFDLEFLFKAGLENNSNKTNSPYSLFLLIPDIIRYAYPIIRYSMVSLFFAEALSLIYKSKNGDV